MFKELLLKVFKMEKSERIKRLIVLGVKENMQGFDFEETIEMSVIQAIRMSN